MAVVGMRRARLEKAARRKKQRRIGLYIFIVLLIVGVGAIIASWGREILYLRMLEIEPVHSGVLKDTVSVTGIVIRDEKVFFAPATGRLVIKGTEGNRLGVGGRVANLETAGADLNGERRVLAVNTPRAGVLTFNFDGLEQEYPYQPLENMPLQAVPFLMDKPFKIHDGQDVKSGAPLFKIINNLNTVYLLIETSKQAMPLPENKDEIWELEFSKGQDLPTLARVVAWDDKPNGQRRVLLTIRSSVPELYRLRQLELTLVKRRLNGLILPRQALVRKNDHWGVMVIERGFICWDRVEYLGTIGEKAVIAGLPEETEVVLNPQRAREGTRVKY